MTYLHKRIAENAKRLFNEKHDEFMSSSAEYLNIITWENAWVRCIGARPTDNKDTPKSDPYVGDLLKAPSLVFDEGVFLEDVVGSLNEGAVLYSRYLTDHILNRLVEKGLMLVEKVNTTALIKECAETFVEMAEGMVMLIGNPFRLSEVLGEEWSQKETVHFAGKEVLFAASPLAHHNVLFVLDSPDLNPLLVSYPRESRLSLHHDSTGVWVSADSIYTDPGFKHKDTSLTMIEYAWGPGGIYLCDRLRHI